MADEEKTKDLAQTETPVEETTVEMSEEATAEVTEAPARVSCQAEEEKTAVEAPEEKSRRLVVAGLVAATVLSLVSVLVAGMFQLTARWLNHRPRELPVNEGLLGLWKEMISDKSVSPQPLGIQDNLVEMTKFKTASPPTK